MQVVLKLALGLLVAIYAIGMLSLVLDPPHAHIPSLVVFGMSPVLPVLWIQEIIAGKANARTCFLLVAFLLVFYGLMRWMFSTKKEAP